MRYKIEKNTVQETLIIPLYARKMCSELYPNLYRDEAARRLMNAVDYDFSALQKKSHKLMQRFGFLEAAMRQNDLAFEGREYLKSHPNINFFIYGHRHIELDLMLSTTSRVLILGDWINYFSYAVFDGENLFLEDYIEGETQA